MPFGQQPDDEPPLLLEVFFQFNHGGITSAGNENGVLSLRFQTQ